MILRMGVLLAGESMVGTGVGLVGMLTDRTEVRTLPVKEPSPAFIGHTNSLEGVSV